MDKMNLTVDIIKNIYKNLVQATEGFEGIKDEDQLSRLLEDSNDFNNAYELASYYLYSVINRRPFIDKNKSMALLLFELILLDSGKEIEFSEKDLYNLIKQVQDEGMTIPEITKFVIRKEEMI